MFHLQEQEVLLESRRYASCSCYTLERPHAGCDVQQHRTIKEEVNSLRQPRRTLASAASRRLTLLLFSTCDDITASLTVLIMFFTI